MIQYNEKNIGKIYENIPTWTNGVWTFTSFNTREEFSKELEDNFFQEPGEYRLNKISKEFNSQANKFNKEGYYCDFIEGTIDFEDYWQFEKKVCSIRMVISPGT